MDSLFPIFVDLTKKDILVVGAGYVAGRKLEKLLLFVPKLKCVALSASDEIIKWKEEGLIDLEIRSLEIEEVLKFDLVIVAVDDVLLQKNVFDLCQKHSILCNCVDSPQYCSFIFPALIKRDGVVVGITTAGKAPAVSSALRQYFERVWPNHIAETIKESRELRIKLKEEGHSFPKRAGHIIGFVQKKLFGIQHLKKNNVEEIGKKEIQ